jgi:hypothetical protein
MMYLSYYLLCLLFNKIGEEGRTGSAWNQGGWRGKGEEMAQQCIKHPNVHIFEFLIERRERDRRNI